MLPLPWKRQFHRTKPMPRERNPGQYFDGTNGGFGRMAFSETLMSRDSTAEQGRKAEGHDGQPAAQPIVNRCSRTAGTAGDEASQVRARDDDDEGDDHSSFSS